MSNISVRSFLVPKRGDCGPLNSFIDASIGNNPALIHSIAATPIDANTTRVDLWFLDKYPEPYKHVSIPKGVVLTTGLYPLDLRVVFNDAIATGSILSGLVSIDGSRLPVAKYLASQFFLNANLSGYTTTGYHYLAIDKDKLTYASSTSRLLSSYYTDYTVYGQSTAGQLVGNKLPLYQRGLIRVTVLRSRSSNVADRSVNNFLLANNISSSDVLFEASCIDPLGVHETYLLYTIKPEPELVSSSPASDTLLPLSCAPVSVTLGFSVPVDSGQVTSQSGLFTIFSGYNSYTNVPPNLVSVGSDSKFVTIALTGYISSNRVYSIVANPGIRSRAGATKSSPDLWSVYIDNYQTGSVGTASALSGIDQSTFAAHTGDTTVHFTTGNIDHTRIQNIGSNTHAQLDSFVISTTGNYAYLSGVARTHINDTNNPHAVTATQLGAATTGSYAYLSGIVNTHTGDTTVHFTPGSIQHSGLLGLTGDHHLQYFTTGRANVWLTGGTTLFTGHTGNSSIHFTQGEISIDSTQISDFSTAVGTTLTSNISVYSGISLAFPFEGFVSIGLSGWLYTGIIGHHNDTSIHFTKGSVTHSGLIGLTGDDHGQYFTTGRANVWLTGASAFTGHTGDSTIHFTQAQISIPSTQISDFTEAAQDAVGAAVIGLSGITASYVDASNVINLSLSGWLYTGITGHIGSRSNPHAVTAAQVGAPTVIDFTNHTSDSTIHFTQGEIAITESQVTDFRVMTRQYAQETLRGLSGISINISDPADTQIGLSGWLYTGITGHQGNTGIHFTQAQISIPYTQILNFSTGVTGVSPTIAQFTSHTGDSTVHFTQWSVPHSGLVGLTGDHHLQYFTTGRADIWLTGGTTLFTGHTGDSTIHFTQSQISIQSTQISDWTEAVQDVVGGAGFIQFGSGISGNYSDAGNSYTFSGLFATTTSHGVASFSSSDFTATGGVITVNDGGINIPSTQVNDFTEAVQDVVGNTSYLKFATGVGGTYDDANNTLTITGILASSTTYGVAKFDPLKFTSVTGFVSIPNYVMSMSGIPDVSLTSLVSGQFLMSTATTGGWRNFSLTGKGSSYFIYDYANSQVIISGATGLTPSSNLSDLTSGYAATTNLRVRYSIDDLSPYGADWTTATNGGGSSYQYDPQYASVLRTNDAQGVVVATSANATGLTGAAIFYHAGIGSYLSDNSTYYFRTMLVATGGNVSRWGLFNAVPSIASGIPANGAYFEYDSRSGTMVWAVTASGGNRTVMSTFLSGSTTAWTWTAIESVSTGVRFYQVDDNNNRLLATHSGNRKPGTTTRAMRAFIQAQGAGTANGGIYIDKYAYPIYYHSLPSGITT